MKNNSQSKMTLRAETFTTSSEKDSSNSIIPYWFNTYSLQDNASKIAVKIRSMNAKAVSSVNKGAGSQ